METGKRSIRNGQRFNRFFARPIGKNRTVKKQGQLKDTLHWMQRVITDTLDQTRDIARHLQGASVRESCKQIWNFCFRYFQYEKDEQQKEQIRTPNRSWADRKKGIDCDCFTVLIGSILTHLGIPYVMRMTRYESLDFEHIYPVALTEEGEIIIDAVVHQFDYEVPYAEKEDVEMDLQVLSGVEGERFNEFGDKVKFEHELPIDAEDLFLDEDMELDGFEGRAEREARKKKRKTKRSDRKSERKVKRENFKKLPLKDRIKERVKQGFHVINKLNPGAALLRAGILAGMKLNLFKIASTLRFAYWTEADARKNKMDMSKFNQLQRIKQKIDKIYFGAGGKPDALKKAILTGKGNRNRMVQLNGLGSVIDVISDEDDLRTILGEELFTEEFDSGGAINGLGEPASIATGAAVSTASGVMATIAGLIKKLGGLFKKGSKAAEMFKIQDNADNANEKNRKFSLRNIVSTVKSKIQDRRNRKVGADEFSTRTIDTTDGGLELMEEEPEDEFILDIEQTARDVEGENAEGEGDDSSEESWLKKNGKWFWPVAGIGTAGLIGLGIWVVSRNKKKKSGSTKAVNGLNGPKKKKKPSSTSSRKTTNRSSTNRKKTVKKTTRKKAASRSKTNRSKTTKNSGIKKYELM